MRKLLILAIVTAFISLLVVPVLAISAPMDREYEDITENGMYWLDAVWEEWDLTKCDLVVSYTLDMSGYVPPMNNTAWSGVGVADATGARGWMSSGAPAAAETNPDSQDIDDKLNLGSAPANWDESTYDATGPDTIVTPPIGNPWLNFGIWFDRDGVDQWQANNWGMIDGVTYNTGGAYEVEVTFHAVDENLGTMFAKVNGVETGFYDSWKNGPPDYQPVGKSFTGDMQRMRLYASIYGENVTVTDLQASGCLYWTDVAIDIVPCCSCNPIIMGLKYYVPVAVLSDGEFDASTVDVSTVDLAGAAPRCPRMCDIDRDGDKDLLLFIPNWEMDLDKDSTSATLTADTTDGLHVKGADSVKVICLWRW